MSGIYRNEECSVEIRAMCGLPDEAAEDYCTRLEGHSGLCGAVGPGSLRYWTNAPLFDDQESFEELSDEIWRGEYKDFGGLSLRDAWTVARRILQSEWLQRYYVRKETS